MDKFLGMGLKRFLALSLAVMIVIVMAKTAVSKVEIPGLSTFIRAV
jgi:hypothetical protein